MKKYIGLVVTMLIIHSTTCFAHQWYNFKTAQFETVDGNYTRTSDWRVVKLGGNAHIDANAGAACWYLNYASGSPQNIFLLRKISDFSAYIPQNAAPQGLYQTYIEMGDTPTESTIKVLKLTIQEHKKHMKD